MPGPEHNQVLEHSVHQLLRETHYNNMHHPTPHPTTAQAGISRAWQDAGPNATDRATLVEMTKRYLYHYHLILGSILFC